MKSDFDRLRPNIAIAKYKITHWHSVPSAIPFLVSHNIDKLLELPKVFSFAGEPLYREHVSKLWRAYPQARIVNTYGPTEGTIIFMAHEVSKDDLSYETMPLGTPIHGWDLILQPVDHYRRFVCIVVSENIAKGYYGRESGGFGSISVNGSSTPTFNTGDILNLEDGKLFFSHRTDGMVKLRGVRIELGEIESVARGAGAANPVAFIDGSYLHLVFEASDAVNEKEVIEAKLSQLIPKSRQPSLILCVDRLPRSSNGKIDRAATATKYRRYSDE